MTEDLFRRRTPEAAARQLALVLINLLECQMATLEGMPKSVSKSERKRQEAINATYLAHVIDLDIPADTRGLRGGKCPRVKHAILAAKEPR